MIEEIEDHKCGKGYGCSYLKVLHKNEKGNYIKEKNGYRMKIKLNKVRKVSKRELYGIMEELSKV